MGFLAPKKFNAGAVETARECCAARAYLRGRGVHGTNASLVGMVFGGLLG